MEAWGRGYLKIKLECEAINAPLPTIDVRKGGVSVRAEGCEQYMRLLRYGQYGQVGADDEWKKVGEKDENERSLKEVLQNERSLKEVLKEVLHSADYKKLLPIIEYLEEHEIVTTEKVVEITGKSPATAWRYLQKLAEVDVIQPDGSTNQSVYKRKKYL